MTGAGCPAWRAHLQETIRKSSAPGTSRTVSPDETLARVRPLAQLMGITRIGNITGLDHIGVPVAIAVRPLSRSVSVSQGKGLTLPHALASALMECTELFHAENLLPQAKWRRAHEVATEGGIDLDTLGPSRKPLDDAAVIPWLEGCDLLSDRPCLVPAELVLTDYSAQLQEGMGYFIAGSNGLASGNHPIEAISAGICELVERDAVAVWQAKGVLERARCRVDQATIDDDSCLALLDRFGRARMTVQLWNVTSDIAIPVFVCDIRAREENPSGLVRRFRGAGCHPSPAVALSRALTEAAQARLTYIVGIRDDIAAAAYAETPAQRAGGTLLDALAQRAEPVSYRNRAGLLSDDIAAEVSWELERLCSAGLDRVIAVDLARPEIGVPVVRMVIPGIEGNSADPAYRPGPRARQAAARPR